MPKYTYYLGEGTQTGKGLLVDKSTDLRGIATCIPWTGNLHDQVLWHFYYIALFQYLLIPDCKHGDVFPQV